MYNQGTSGKNFQGKEGKSFKVERQEELGLNLDMTKFRMYDYALGRFTSIDPLADANPQESWTPYQYAYNNPIVYNDPYGDCPECWEFLKGVGRGIGSFISSSVDNYSFQGKAKNNLASAKQPKSNKPLSVQIVASVTDPIGDTVKEGFEAVASGDAGKMGEFVGKNSPALLLTKKLPGKGVKTTPRGKPGKLTKQSRGKGSVPKAERPTPRMPNKKQQKAQYDKDGGKCQNCNNKTPQENTTQHHYPKRHADGGSKTTTVCKDCHNYLHSKDK